ncbi:hypothetical protein GT347_14755 [Xylophilus rhododendri]|uniref:Uncharacterized protein n=1 Tax=Xylophilus rhododendri TaxID=2697032 RepID=A0A857J571_9BURK|nr:hypothetical protein [Xylophilus rhododendri]QHI99134.1 hypothetical protein GT347_14755 [Xylophilus rhododendri]
MPNTPDALDDEKTGLGLLLTALQVLVYFSFIAFCCFHRPSAPPQGVPAVFYFGLAVIASGVAMTVVYVLATNRKESAK